MFDETYDGLRIAPSDAAMRELMKEGLILSDVVEVLEDGHNAPRKRKRGTVEKWLDKGKKTYNAVVVKSYTVANDEEIWLLTHFGKFTKR
ncbi:hypothetical protein AUJ68_02820 [Candidatus Woesearchaeota archaeon CG1_02_57_44]|nr:MAG: hypothetical protein AUJ68_02820 [Candidatus Woesearchaeota archaeon CG1_02_57_44]PIN68532.1 MAG: hypothetical protein COV94_04115 [Candidatus Woesearchaeota archaeon CG11_big_fil_rev_8_21_14_0_20_57_5]